jgi:hypothetical protein
MVCREKVTYKVTYEFVLIFRTKINLIVINVKYTSKKHRPVINDLANKK